jgi:glycosyltransferase involved in cell wall biosynthesis
MSGQQIRACPAPLPAAPPADIVPPGLGESGLFDAAWYTEVYGAVSPIEGDPLAHFCGHGWQAGYRPNPCFDPAWYLQQNPAVARAGENPLLHYLSVGERLGCRPVPYFDPAWYRRAHRIPAASNCLAHYLDLRRSGTVSPLPEFDAAYYLAANPDVADAAIDPFEHYLHQGWREGRRPSPQFDAERYRRLHMQGIEANPLLHWLESGSPDLTEAPATTVAREVRRNAAPGPLFEERRRLPDAAPRLARVLAFYLPQFHAIAENDAWWGTGFTEWANVARGLPRFAGHYQPRIPRDLGAYSLDDPQVMRRQVQMAIEAGLAGFVFYFYWFNRRRLLERPVERFLADPSLRIGFCLMWANENWTRRWDGSDDEVLIAQDYREEDEAELLATFARHFADARHIRVQGRPLLLIYRPGLVPGGDATFARWRDQLRRLHGEDPLLVMAQSFLDRDPRRYGMDAAVEFPPHKSTFGLPLVNHRLDLLDPDFTGQVFDYADVAAAALAEPAPEYPLIRTAVPMWDNDARRQGAGMVLHGSTPDRYQSWLAGLIAQARRHPLHGEPIVCINAWNEWAEGATLEPDQHFGSAYLNATARAIAGAAPMAPPGRLLLVGHDALAHGAQTLLLHLARQLARRHGLELTILLLAGGPLEAAYREVAHVVLLAGAEDVPGQLRELHAAGYRAAIVNSAASAGLCPALLAAGIPPLLLVHELPGILAEKSLLAGATAGAAAATQIVCAAPVVAERFAAATGHAGPAPLLLPQGLYRPVAFSEERRRALRERLGLPPGAVLAIGIGYADLRKGFDLFLQVWRETRRAGRDIHLCWIGGMDPGMRAFLGAEIDAAIAAGGLHLPGWQEDPSDFLCAADVHLLTSREDPFPSVVLEAASAGLPTVAFAGTGGAPELLERLGAGESVPLADVHEMARSLARLARTARKGLARLPVAVREIFAFDRYAAELLRLARPTLPRISVVVPSFNYGRFMAERLASILGQTHPVHEVIVLDDASTDDSVARARQVAAEWRRDVAVVENATPSGSVFRQWARAAELAGGEWLWIAEADDAADPRLLETLAQALDHALDQGGDPVLAFCDSQAIDAEGRVLAADHKHYYREAAAAPLAGDCCLPAREFLARCLAGRNTVLNASAVLWRRDALCQAIAAVGEELAEYRLAGDWRLLVELLDRDPATVGGEVAYSALPLNRHRRHGGGVTAGLDATRHLQEIERVQRLVAERLGGGPALAALQAAARRDAARSLGVAPAGRGAAENAARRRSRRQAPA